LLLFAAAAMAIGDHLSKDVREKALQLITPFYSVFNAGVDPTVAITSVTTPDWVSCGNNDVGCQTVAGVVSTFIVGFGNVVVPGSITFQFQDIIVAGDTITVRGELSAIPLSINSPPFNFCNAARARFTIMTQDIHTIKHGLIAHTYHIEDFAGAIAQIKTANPTCVFPLAVARVNLLPNAVDAVYPIGSANVSFTVNGTITFTQADDSGIVITGTITGLPPNTTHGWHIHQFGIDETLESTNSSGMCLAAGAHFNPAGVPHGTLNNGHAGDLGNFVSDLSGTFNVPAGFVAKLTTVPAIVGRTLVIHHDVDDLGKAGTNSSITVGTSGKRVACGNIHLVAAK